MRKLILASLIALSFNSVAQADDVECIVSKSVANYKSISVRTPHTTPYTTQVRHETQCGYTYKETSKKSLGWDTAIGAIAGGFLGNQVGGGNGKKWATAGGAVLGGVGANQLRSGNYEKVPKYCVVTDNVTRYRTTYTYETVNEKDGYTNYFTYNGVTYSKKSQRPLAIVTVHTNISY